MPEEQATQRLVEILGQIKKLPSANLEPPQFFANYLQLSVAATGSRGGAIWLTQTDQPPQCYCHMEIELCGINESEEQKRLVIEAVQRTVTEGKPLVVPPGSSSSVVSSEVTTEQGAQNRCSYPLFFYPLRAANQVAMVLHYIGSETLSPEDYRAVVGLLGQIAEAGQAYLAHRRAAVLEDDRKANNVSFSNDSCKPALAIGYNKTGHFVSSHLHRRCSNSLIRVDSHDLLLTLDSLEHFIGLSNDLHGFWLLKLNSFSFYTKLIDMSCLRF